MKKKLYHLYGLWSTMSPKITIGIFDEFSKMMKVKLQYADKIPHIYYDDIELNQITNTFLMTITPDDQMEKQS